MDNMVANVCAKSNYDRLHIDKALGNLANLITTPPTTFVAIRDPFPGPKFIKTCTPGDCGERPKHFHLN